MLHYLKIFHKMYKIIVIIMKSIRMRKKLKKIQITMIIIKTMTTTINKFYKKNRMLIIIIIKKNKINSIINLNLYTVIFSEFYMRLLILKMIISFKSMNNNNNSKICPLLMYLLIIYCHQMLTLN